jgi:hypothetical protein
MQKLGCGNDDDGEGRREKKEREKIKKGKKVSK